MEDRQELELLLKTKILEEHESELLYVSNEDDTIEVISNSEKSGSENVSNLDDDETKGAEEAENIDDHEDSNIDYDEQQEIKELLLEEFQRLPTELEKGENENVSRE